MDLVKLRIPYAYLRHRARFDWRELRFGLVNELLDPMAPIELAMEQVVELDHPSPALLELAGLVRHEPAGPLVDQLAESEHQRAEDQIRDKWLYVVLAWIYDHRDEFPDPLQAVETVYADFGYPPRIADFVRYMPMIGPDLGSPMANQRRIYERWKRFIDEAGRVYGPQPRHSSP